MFPPLNQKNICMETLESDTIQAVKLLWSSFSSLLVPFCLLKTVQFHQRWVYRTNKKKSLFIVLQNVSSNVLQNFPFLVHCAWKLWTNNWISMNLSPNIDDMVTGDDIISFSSRVVWQKINLDSRDSTWVIWPNLNE